MQQLAVDRILKQSEVIADDWLAQKAVAV